MVTHGFTIYSRFDRGRMQGDVDARRGFAVMYCDGRGVAQDHNDGARRFRRAADMGVSG